MSDYIDKLLLQLLGLSDTQTPLTLWFGGVLLMLNWL